MDFSSEGLVMGSHSVHLWEESGPARDRHLVTINMLPDDVLLEIFYFSESIVHPVWSGETTWCALVHVCQRWRYLVFAFPRRLNLRLEYRGHRPMSEVLDAWPVLPVSVISSRDQSDQRWDNTVAALESEHYNRISEIKIDGIITNSRWERFTAAMQKPFPELTHLQVWMDDVARFLPDSFLGESAPRLRSLSLKNTSFPSIPKLLLSANRLVTLNLRDIPDSGSFSLDEMATALAGMTRLICIGLHFRYSRSRPDRPLPPPTRFVLPALTHLMFEGVHEYLEDLLARIDPPRLHYLNVKFLMDLDSDVPQLHRLIGHAEKFKKFNCADVLIYNVSIRLCLYPNTVQVDGWARLELKIDFRETHHQLSSLIQACSPPFTLISAFALEELKIRGDRLYPWPYRTNHVENAQWLELLEPFTALRILYLPHGIAHRFCGSFQELPRERTREVLPALRNLFVRRSSSEPVQEAIKSFVTARQVSGHPVVVDDWKD